LYDMLAIFFSSIIAVIFILYVERNIKVILLEVAAAIVVPFGIAFAYSAYHILYVLNYIRYMEMGAFDVGLILYCVLMNFKTAIPNVISITLIGSIIGLIIGGTFLSAHS